MGMISQIFLAVFGDHLLTMIYFSNAIEVKKIKLHMQNFFDTVR